MNRLENRFTHATEQTVPPGSIRPTTPPTGLTCEQLDALVLGLPWQLVGEAGIIHVL